MPPDFRVFLRQDLVQRCRRNPQYSLRAYARFLQTEPSALSRLMRGRRALSRKMFAHLADRCGLSPEQRTHFHDRHFGLPAAETPESSYETITADRFQLLADWYHWALVELVRVEGFSNDARRLARVLGISVAEVQEALARLLRLGLLREDGGQWIAVDRFTTVDFPGSTTALRELQRQYLQKASAALEDIPFEERDQSTLTLACDPADLPQLKKAIRQFRRSLDSLAARGAHKQRVYALTVALFPLTKEFSGGSKS